LVTLVFHDQSIDIAPNLRALAETLRNHGMPGYTIHAGPLIRRESEYNDFSRWERQQAFNCLFHFARMVDITYTTLLVEKRQLASGEELNARIKKQLRAFLRSQLERLTAYDKVILYYDHGQNELNSILVSMFMEHFTYVEFRKVNPANYKLFQAADMICTLELLALKAERKSLTKSELAFFSSESKLQKNYIRQIRSKRI
jgi:hypothetical protein